VSAERLVPIEGGTPGGMNRHFDKHTGRMAQIGLIQQVKLRETWPTPHGFSPDGRTNGPSGNELGRAVNQSLWPTPTAACANGGQTSRSGKRKGELLLAGAVKAFPTPMASEARQGYQNRNNGKKGSQESLTTVIQGGPASEVGGSLNPTWVEWLMGWPLGWTDSALSATDRFRQWLRSHGSF
jgi:hypothetical protein